MVFLTAFNRLFKKIFDYKNRVTTREFMFGLAWVLVLNIDLPGMTDFAFTFAMQNFGFDDYLPFHVVLVTLSVITFMAALALVVRRLRGLNRPIFWAIPMAVWLVFTVVKSVYDLIPMDMFDTEAFNNYDKLTNFQAPVGIIAFVITMFAVAGAQPFELRKPKGFAAAVLKARADAELAAGLRQTTVPTYCANCVKAETKPRAKFCHNCGSHLTLLPLQTQTPELE